MFAVLPTPIDARKTEAVLAGAIAAAETNKAAAAATQPTQATTPPLTIGALRPQAAPPGARAGADNTRRILLAVAAVALLAAAAGGAGWFFQDRQPAAAPPPTLPAAPGGGATVAAPLADTSIVQGKVDELLEKARLAMHERRFTEPAGDNALLYYRSAVAANANNAEARDGLQRVAGVLAGRFDEAVNGGRLRRGRADARQPQVGRPGRCARAPPSSSACTARRSPRRSPTATWTAPPPSLHQAQQSSSIPAEQLAQAGARDVTHRQDDAKVQHLAGLVDDRIRDGQLWTIRRDSAKALSARAADRERPATPPRSAPPTPCSAPTCTRPAMRRWPKNNAEQIAGSTRRARAGLTPAEILAFAEGCGRRTPEGGAGRQRPPAAGGPRAAARRLASPIRRRTAPLIT